MLKYDKDYSRYKNYKLIAFYISNTEQKYWWLILQSGVCPNLYPINVSLLWVCSTCIKITISKSSSTKNYILLAILKSGNMCYPNVLLQCKICPQKKKSSSENTKSRSFFLIFFIIICLFQREKNPTGRSEHVSACALSNPSINQWLTHSGCLHQQALILLSFEKPFSKPALILHTRWCVLPFIFEKISGYH